jgi:PadR family transcriptional regulator PadR
LHPKSGVLGVGWFQHGRRICSQRAAGALPSNLGAGFVESESGSMAIERATDARAETRIKRDVVLAFARVHVLHHAAEGAIFGLEMMQELKRHGYEIGPSMMYPLLHGLESSGALRSEERVVDGKVRRYYRATKSGNRLLAELRDKIAELVQEVGVHKPKRKQVARRSS